jgi:hypothetical protein
MRRPQSSHSLHWGLLLRQRVEVADRKEIQDRLSHFHLHQGESVSADRRRGFPTG